MRELKGVEIRDEATCVVALAIRVTGGPSDRLLWRAGYGNDPPLVLLVHLTREVAYWDPFSWGNRTMREAHLWLQRHWDEHADNGVVDVQYVVGETDSPKISELGGPEMSWRR